jgi:hypothetical protein
MEKKTFNEEEVIKKYFEISRKAISSNEVMRIISKLSNGHEETVGSQNRSLGILYKRAMDLSDDCRELFEISECCYDSNTDISKQAFDKAMACAKNCFEILKIVEQEYANEDFGKKILLKYLDGCNKPEEIAHIAYTSAYYFDMEWGCELYEQAINLAVTADQYTEIARTMIPDGYNQLECGAISEDIYMEAIDHSSGLDQALMLVDECFRDTAGYLTEENELMTMLIMRVMKKSKTKEDVSMILEYLKKHKKYLDCFKKLKRALIKKRNAFS